MVEAIGKVVRSVALQNQITPVVLRNGSANKATNS